MILVLLPTFILTALLFGSGSYFACRFVFIEATDKQLKKARFISWLFAIFFPIIYFFTYMLAQPKNPEDPPVTYHVALIPAIWAFILCFSIVIGLSIGLKKRQR